MGVLVVRGGEVHDGLGSPAVHADVVLTDGRVNAVGGGVPSGAEVLNATGKVVCPGFVDIHTHSDLTVLSNGLGPSKIRQGVTTEVVGNCGLGMAPLGETADLDELRPAAAYLDVDPAVTIGWRDQRGYLDALAGAGLGLNVGALAAHIPIRGSVLGLGDTAPSAADLDAMCGLLGAALDAGALGLSTGLVYAPLCYAPPEELRRLAEVVAERGKLFAWHVRDYGDDLLESVTQALEVTRATGVRTQISHLVSVGRRNWGSVRKTLDLVDAANASGFDVGVDVYPYTAGNAPLAQLLPPWVQDGGTDAMRERLHDDAVRAEVLDHFGGNPLGWDEIAVCAVPPDGDHSLVGRFISDLGGDGNQAALELLATYGGAVMMVAYGRDEGDVRAVLDHPAAVVASDGQALDPDGPTGAGRPHPRSYGTFPRYLSRYADDLADGIRRCTSAPADRVGLTDRGRLVPGAAADLLVLDPATLADTATFTEPARFPTGVDAVVVNGRLTLDHGRDLGVRAGSVLTA